MKDGKPAIHIRWNEIGQKYGGIYSLQVGRIFWVVLHDWEAVRVVMKNTKAAGRPAGTAAYLDDSSYNVCLRFHCRRSRIVCLGQRFGVFRGQTVGCCSPRDARSYVLKGYAASTAKCGQRCDRLPRLEHSQSRGQRSVFAAFLLAFTVSILGPFSPHLVLKRTTTNVIAQLVFGSRFADDDATFNRLIESYDVLFRLYGVFLSISWHDLVLFV